MRRLPQLVANALSRAVEARRDAGQPLIDLTASNPTAVQLPFGDADELARAIGQHEVAHYRPAPRGLASARAAVAAESDHIDSRRLLLCSCSSEAYSFLFKALGEPGDVVLAPRPSYPLIEHLARLDGLRVVSYPLRYDGRWHVDRDGLSAAMAQARAACSGGARVCAVIAVSPNNPTGSYLGADEQRALDELCAALSASALIVDEVFFDYPNELDEHDGAAARLPALARTRDVLTFSLGGLSKSCALPQIKMSWIAAAGPRHAVDETLGRLELISDTYLTLSAAPQLAAQRLLTLGHTRRALVAGRVGRNRRALGQLCEGSSVTALHSEAGWSAMLRVPQLEGEERLCIDLVERHGVLVHPGYFFDLERGGAHLVISLLPEAEPFAAGVERLLARVATAS